MRFVAAGAAVLAALVTACGGGSPAGPGGAPVSPAAGADVRGASLPAFACTGPAGGDVRVPAADVGAVRLCALPALGGPAVTVRPDDPRWDQLLGALSADDVPPDPGAVCPAYANVEQRVVADSTRGPLVVHIPVDGCHHYQRDALTILTAIRADPHPAATATAAGPRCPAGEDVGGAQVIVDFVDFVQALGRQYVAGGLGRASARGAVDRLGRTVLVSRCSFSAFNERTHRSPGEPRDGDTAFLPPGTAIRAYDGWPARCRLAAVLDGEVHVYLALRTPSRHAVPRACALRRH